MRFLLFLGVCIHFCHSTLAFEKFTHVGFDMAGREPYYGRIHGNESMRLPYYSMEASRLGLTMTRDKERDKVRLSNNAVFGILGMVLHPFLAIPQWLTNFRAHFRPFDQVFSLYVGQNTDYYLWYRERYVYTETLVGIRLDLGDWKVPFSPKISLGLGKPWSKAYLGNKKVNLAFRLSFGEGEVPKGVY